VAVKVYRENYRAVVVVVVAVAVADVCERACPLLSGPIFLGQIRTTTRH